MFSELLSDRAPVKSTKEAGNQVGKDWAVVSPNANQEVRVRGRAIDIISRATG